MQSSIITSGIKFVMTLSQSQNCIKSLKLSLKRTEVCDKRSSCHFFFITSPKDCVGDVLTVVNSPCSFLHGVGGGCNLNLCHTSLPNGTATPSPAGGTLWWGLPEVQVLPRLS